MKNVGIPQGQSRRSISAQPVFLSYTTLFNPVLTENELPRKRVPRPHQPTQCTIGYTCHDVLVDSHRLSQRIPTLRLSGQWLEALRFASGSKAEYRHRRWCAGDQGCTARVGAESSRRSTCPGDRRWCDSGAERRTGSSVPTTRDGLVYPFKNFALCCAHTPRGRNGDDT